MAKANRSVSSPAGRRPAPGLVADLADMIRTIKAMFDTYHPELHYMRGPGPKWHAKHARPTADAAAVPALIRAQG
jgi:hypothetical protein